MSLCWLHDLKSLMVVVRPVGRWEAPRPVHLLGALQNNISSPDAAVTLVVDISALAELTEKQPQAQEETSKATRKQVAQILAALAPCGMDEDVDAACRDAFRAGQGDKVAWGLIRYAEFSMSLDCG